MADIQTADSDQHAYGIEQKEHGQLAAHVGASTISKCPIAIAEIGHDCCNRDADDFCANWSIKHRPLAAGEAQQVEESDIHHEGAKANDPEFRYLMEKGGKLTAKALNESNDGVRRRGLWHSQSIVAQRRGDLRCFVRG